MWTPLTPGETGGLLWAAMRPPEKGGESMQQPIRYYITKSGDEPTVRSVKVALGSTAAEERPEPRAANPAPSSTTAHEAIVERSGVKQIVQEVIRRRTKTT
jgi:hypothetical protein